MPILHVRALPTHDPTDVRSVVEGLCEDVAAATGIALAEISVTWTWLAAGHYATGGTAGAAQAEDEHPILVDVLVADRHPQERIERLLLAVADGLGRRTEVTRENVVVTAVPVRSGHVLGRGRIERW
ncbi:hypothetical protein PAI11_14610 [Patulibacter medicamentivorans]|jgi:phenylpyruvate tautomerase PptA (4-oxalocrotonate tautomerase family)|uniref:4-oxalocrotonate tautomerase domain-containing protein n=1 Tax=Patulibacter medicamentivorans TaxID=1097667 RepID=H0E3T7_9ACTN|nr:hypothetical protein [Patulibacter medicamentivorans]EHN11656.1 hypothetical protein PAI11_14610 [Patulibacter medicamentivorans]